MKPLSSKELERRKVIKLAIEDYFGERIPEEKFGRLYKAVLSKEYRDLEVDEYVVVGTILRNLEDPLYIAVLAHA